jgi:hypothetical protein
MEARAGRDGGIILTTSHLLGSQREWPHRFVAREIRDLLTADAGAFHLHVGLLKSIYTAPADIRCPGSPFHLSPDNRRLVVHGTTIKLRGSVHQSIIRKLVDGYIAGERLPADTVLAESAADTIAKAFHNSKNWQVLGRHVRQRGGLCWLEP